MLLIHVHPFLCFNPQAQPLFEVPQIPQGHLPSPVSLCLLCNVLQIFKSSHPFFSSWHGFIPDRALISQITPMLATTSVSTPRIYTRHMLECSFLSLSLSLTLSLSFSRPLSQGERGVEEVLNILKDEFHTSMALTGECVYSSFPYLELKVGVAPPHPHPMTLSPGQGLPEERVGKKQPEQDLAQTPNVIHLLQKQMQLPITGKEGSILLWVVQTPIRLVRCGSFKSHSWAPKSRELMPERQHGGSGEEDTNRRREGKALPCLPMDR